MTAIWYNGVVMDAGQACVPILDRGFALGDGLFETMLWNSDRVRFFDDHMARLTDGALALGFVMPFSKAEIKAGLEALAQEAMGLQAVIRLTLSRGSGPRGLALPNPAAPLLVASIAPFERSNTPVSLQTVAITRNAGAPSAMFKTLSYIDNIMALREAQIRGADDAIMLGSTGYLACASSANLVLRLKGASLTPALSDGALPGIVRHHLIQAGLIEEAHISPAQLANCEGAVLTNALIGVRAVSMVNDRLLNNDPSWIIGLQNALMSRELRS